jgi:ketosteroid isomerase-like protein
LKVERSHLDHRRSAGFVQERQDVRTQEKVSLADSASMGVLALRTLTLVVLLACAGTSTGFAQGASDSDVGSKIIALENLWSQASTAKDLKALDTILDDAFVYVGPDGKLMTKAEVLADVKASPVLQVTTESMVVHLHGDTAVVTGTYRMKGVERGGPFVRSGRFVDTLLYKNGLWVAIASLATPIWD